MKTAYVLVIFAFVAFIALSLDGGQEDKRLDLLFADLAKSKNAGETKSIEHSIWQIWIEKKFTGQADYAARYSGDEFWKITVSLEGI